MIIRTEDTTISEMGEMVKAIKVGQTANVIIQKTMKQLTVQATDKVYHNVGGLWVARNGYDFRIVETTTYLDDTVACSM